MALMRCLSCDGVYETQQRDGLRYFHVCPPSVVTEVVRDGKRIQIAIGDLQGTDLLTVRRDGKLDQVAAAALTEADVRLNDQEVERDNARNENVKIVGFDKAGKALVEPKAAGAGAELVK
jgi:hypothetical protein